MWICVCVYPEWWNNNKNCKMHGTEMILFGLVIGDNYYFFFFYCVWKMIWSNRNILLSRIWEWNCICMFPIWFFSYSEKKNIYPTTFFSLFLCLSITQPFIWNWRNNNKLFSLIINKKCIEEYKYISWTGSIRTVIFWWKKQNNRKHCSCAQFKFLCGS